MKINKRYFQPSFYEHNSKGLKSFFIIALIVAVFILFFKSIKNFLTNLGLLKDPASEAKDKAKLVIAKLDSDKDIANAAAAQTSLKQQYDKLRPTKTDLEFQGIADTIYSDTQYYFDSDNNFDDMQYQLCRAKNLSDVFKIIDFFGKKSEKVFGFVTTKKDATLPEWVRYKCSEKRVADINNNYKSKNIPFSW